MAAPPRPRKFLVVVDRTPECQVAVRFAARRAGHTGGRVTLLCAVAPGTFRQWRGVAEIMRDEARAEAETLLYAAAGTVNAVCGILPELVIRFGTAADCLTKLLSEDKDISILVLAAGTDKDGPGPLVSMFAGAVQSVPVTIVPGNLTPAEIDALA